MNFTDQLTAFNTPSVVNVANVANVDNVGNVASTPSVSNAPNSINTLERGFVNKMKRWPDGVIPYRIGGETISKIL